MIYNMAFYLWILFITWELPQAVLAGCIAAINCRRITGSETYNHARILYVKDFPGGISLGRLIFLNNKYSVDDMSKKHEYGHTLQSLFLGWTYLLVVGIPSIYRAVLWRIKKLDSYSYFLGYPENWANKLGFTKEELLEAEERLG